jgi:hypothetical protein
MPKKGQRLVLISPLMLMALAALVVLGHIFGWKQMIFSASVSFAVVASLGWYRSRRAKGA